MTSDCVWITSDCVWMTSDCVWMTSDCVWMTSDCVWMTSDCPPHQALRDRVNKAREKEAEKHLPQDPRSRLARHLGVRGFKIKDVPGDNNCQFHAIADQLEQVMA
jgi:hypothetical protein